ncbi:kinase-like domain-containing protein [Bombardia bombarda]|uniref:Kinase-like domain-containing protein n=1 Tax=Bombardia bombarda TaxID=252184 RepID=A0AA39XMN0_9PEZI|nr:kinase-like domain-containing protein [Bombardia bombarda]
MSTPSSTAGGSPKSASTMFAKDLRDYQSNGLRLELAPFGLDKIYDYEAGGHYPVYFGDFLGTDYRYRVIHKLGSGGFANVWLCCDTAAEGLKYVAVKALMADMSTDDCPELRMAAKLKENYKDLCREVVKAVDLLHSNGICHGDLTPNNILQHIISLDGRPEDEVLRILGQPVRNPATSNEEPGHNLHTAPQYLVYPIRWEDVSITTVLPKPCLIDLGESYTPTQPPSDLGIPGPYRAPELMLDKTTGGFGADLWALGYTLFEMRTGERLFNLFDDGDNEYLEAVVEMLSPLLELWEKRKEWEVIADLLGKLLVFDPTRRISAREVLEHAWFRL